jgi:general secretion pathway protein G
MTVIELLIGVAVLAVVTALLVPHVMDRFAEAKVHRAVMELQLLAGQIDVYSSELGDWPKSLEELPRPVGLDPWGNPYRYLPSTDRTWRRACRRDRFLVPLNNDFDLYSVGPDGVTQAPLTAKQSGDDIVRADGGAFFGRAADF